MNTTSGDARKRVRKKALLYLSTATIVVVALLYFEQIAALFVLATLALSAFLVVVAFADLKGNDITLNKQINEFTETNDANKRQPNRGNQAVKNVRGE